MRFCDLKSLKFKLLAILCWGLLAPSLAFCQAFSPSVTVGHDVFQGRAPVTDMNLLFGSYGFRLTYMPSSTELRQSERTTQQAVDRAVVGETVSYGLMKFWDMRRYQPSQGMPLSFLGMYNTFGYSHSPMELRTTRLKADQSHITATATTQTIHPTSWLMEAGFFGGDRFALIDLRLQYRTSSFEPDWKPGKIRYQSWAMILSGGIGF